jgi:hypothetical protein
MDDNDNELDYLKKIHEVADKKLSEAIIEIIGDIEWIEYRNLSKTKREIIKARGIALSLGMEISALNSALIKSGNTETAVNLAENCKYLIDKCLSNDLDDEKQIKKNKFTIVSE